MKKIYLLTVLAITSASAQIIDIPDANFKNALISTVCADLNGDNTLDGDVDTNDNGEIELSEALAVHSLFYLQAPFRMAGSLSPAINEFEDLTGIEAFQNLKRLDVSNHLLTTLDVSMLPLLQRLKCDNNNLTALNVTGLANLTALSCQGNALTALDVSSLTGLTHLYCNDNSISQLDLGGLQNLVFLQATNAGLEQLTFGENWSLDRIYAGNNALTLLDASQTGARLIYCNDNPALEYVNIKNGVVSPFNGIENPPLLMNLPSLDFSNLPSLQFVCCDPQSNGPFAYPEEQLTLSSHLNGIGSQAVTSTYCTFIPGGLHNTITGTLYGECGASGPVAHARVDLVGAQYSVSAFTNAQGVYTFYVPGGTFTVSPYFGTLPYHNATPPEATVTFSGVGEAHQADFCLTPNGTHPDLTVSIIALNPARPGFDADYKIVVTNKGTEALQGELALNYPEQAELISSQPTAGAVSGGIATWQTATLYPFESQVFDVTMNINGPMDTPPVEIGNTLGYQASITAGPDETPEDNEAILTQTVVGAFDPNDKAVSRNLLDITEVNSYLNYVIRFENTGNFAAENIVVTDFLPPTLDLSTLEITGASHPFDSTLSQNRLEVVFEGIDLPPSNGSPGTGHGYVAFRVKPAATVGVGSIIDNEARIYFDYNWPIVTNLASTAIVELANPEFFSSMIVLYPNPARGSFSISSVSNVTNVSILNSLGQRVKRFEGSAPNFDVADLAKGIYFVEVHSSEGKMVEKLVKE